MPLGEEMYSRSSGPTATSYTGSPTIAHRDRPRVVPGGRSSRRIAPSR